jgi:O-antigen/teichoic acid export membrane protein
MAELGATNVLRLASNLVMTRLLVPEAFGLMAMVTTLHVGLTLFTDIGIQQSVVRSPNGNDPRFLRVAWVVQIVRCTAIALIVVAVAGALWLLAPGLAPAGTVYADPVLPGLIAVSALVMVMRGLESTAQWLAARSMALARLTMVNLSSQIVSLLAMVAFAQIEATVWALLWGMIAGTVFRTVMSHLLFRTPRMAYAWDSEVAQELWGFGKFVLAASAFGFLANHADRLILGALLSAENFGYYVIAYTWVQVFILITQKLIGQIGYSAFSEVQRDRPDRIVPVFRRFSMAIDIVCVLGFLICLLAGPWLIHTLYEPIYATAAGFMPLLALSVLTRRFNALGMLVLSSGNSRASMQTAAARAIAICIALPLGFHFFGMAGAILGLSFSQLAGVPLVIRRAAKVLNGHVRIDILWIFAILAVGAVVYWFYGRL